MSCKIRERPTVKKYSLRFYDCISPFKKSFHFKKFSTEFCREWEKMTVILSTAKRGDKLYCV